MEDCIGGPPYFLYPPGQVWADFVHRTDELVVLAEGEIQVEIEGKSQRPQIGEEVFFPAKIGRAHV